MLLMGFVIKEVKIKEEIGSVMGTFVGGPTSVMHRGDGGHLSKKKLNVGKKCCTAAVSGKGHPTEGVLESNSRDL